MERALTNFGYMAINAGLAAAVLFFGRKWMSGVERTAKENREEMIKQNQETCDDLKEIIERNREEYKEKADGIIESLNKLSDHVATANGRTTKNELAIAHLEGTVNTQIAMCEARNKGRLSGPCGVQ